MEVAGVDGGQEGEAAEPGSGALLQGGSPGAVLGAGFTPWLL